nr:gliding motility protein GldM [Bacteroidota bacterium]
MSTAKLPPRQKMINMMYLVLTAMLALNISKEVINAFVTVNTSLEKSFDNQKVKKQRVFELFAQQMQHDSLRAQLAYSKALAVSQQSDKVCADIETLKNRLINETEGVKQNASFIQLQNVKRKDAYEKVTNIMCGDDEQGRGAEATKLKQIILNYKQSVLTTLDEKDRIIFKPLLDKNFDTSDPAKDDVAYKEDHKTTWEMKYFYQTPVVASVAMLSKIQTDVKNAEAEVLEHLLNGITADKNTFDKLVAQVVMPTDYIFTGQPVKADIFLTAYNSTLSSDVNVNGQQITMENGIAKFVTTAQGEGLKKITGSIKVKQPDNTYKDYDFEKTYMAAKSAAVISPVAMNIIYIGLENPISISVPGIAPEKLSVTTTGGGLTLQKVSGSNYIAKATSVTQIASVNCYAEIDGRKVLMGTQDFRTREVPTPIATVGKIKGGRIATSLLLAQSGIVPLLENFDFNNVFYRITSFTFSLYGKRVQVSGLQSTSNALTQPMKDIIKKCAYNDKVIFENIKAVDPAGKTRTLPPVSFDLQ